ncbi:hypothetical protein CM49_05178 [Paenibacillus sp. P1XP2]|nr:hypothetical protein CM49_05178 [Paenibacillus sp. P1XP2]
MAMHTEARFRRRRKFSLLDTLRFIILAVGAVAMLFPLL